MQTNVKYYLWIFLLENGCANNMSTFALITTLLIMKLQDEALGVTFQLGMCMWLGEVYYIFKNKNISIINISQARYHCE